MGRAESPWKHISLGGKGGNYVRAHDKDGQRADRMKPQSDSTRPRRLAIKKLDLAPYPLRLAVAELLEFSRDSVSSRLCPGCGLPSLGWTGDWPWQSGGDVGWSVYQHPSCPSAGITKGRAGDGNSCSIFHLKTGVGFRWKLVLQWSCHRGLHLSGIACPGRMPRRCDVQSLEWKTLSEAAQCDCRRQLGTNPICHLEGTFRWWVVRKGHDTARETKQHGSTTP